MSYAFRARGAYVWDPASRVGRMFVGLTQGASAAMGLASGLTANQDDTCDIDVDVFKLFVDELRRWYFSTQHPVQHHLLRGVLLTSLVLLNRSGISIEPASAAEEIVYNDAIELGLSMVQ
jgi:hypothetical protein